MIGVKSSQSQTGSRIAANTIVFPLTYDEESSDGAISLSRSGIAPWVTDEGFKGDGYSSRYIASSGDLPAWAKGAGSQKVSLQASVKAYWRSRAGVNDADIVVSLCENTAQANPKLEVVCVDDARLDDVAVVRAQYYTGTLRQTPLFRNTWEYQFRAPELKNGTDVAKPQGVLFLDSETVLVTVHFSDTLSRVYKMDLPTKTVIEQFDFASPYNHVASIAKRDSDSTYWFGDYATGELLEVDLNASFSSGTASITSSVDMSALTGFGAVEWINVSGTDYLLALEYATTGTRWLYVYDKMDVTGTPTTADRYKRFEVGADRNQGLSYHSGKLYVAVNRLRGGSFNDGRIIRFDVDTAVSSGADGSSLVAEDWWPAPSAYPEDLAFHPSTGEVWTGTEGFLSVNDFEGFMGFWSGSLNGHKPDNIKENHITIEYDGLGASSTITIKLNNQVFREIEDEIVATPAVLSIGGKPLASGGQSSSFFAGTVRDVILKEDPITLTEYNKAVNGNFETKSLTKYVATLTNSGAETGDATGWTNEVGGLAVRSANPDPYKGSYYFFGGANAQTIASQEVDVLSLTSKTPAEIDALASSNSIWARVDWAQTSYSSSDAGGAGLRNLDNAGTSISETYSAIFATDPEKLWGARGFAKGLETGTEKIDVLLRMDRSAGTNNDAYVDDVEFAVYIK